MGISKAEEKVKLTRRTYSSRALLNHLQGYERLDGQFRPVLEVEGETFYIQSMHRSTGRRIVTRHTIQFRGINNGRCFRLYCSFADQMRCDEYLQCAGLRESIWKSKCFPSQRILRTNAQDNKFLRSCGIVPPDEEGNHA